MRRHTIDITPRIYTTILATWCAIVIGVVISYGSRLPVPIAAKTFVDSSIPLQIEPNTQALIEEVNELRSLVRRLEAENDRLRTEDAK